MSGALWRNQGCRTLPRVDAKLALLAIASAALLLVAAARVPRGARLLPLDPLLVQIAIRLVILVGMVAIARLSMTSSDEASAVRGPERGIEVEKQVVRVLDAGR
jgi:hypothetical protein